MTSLAIQPVLYNLRMVYSNHAQLGTPESLCVCANCHGGAFALGAVRAGRTSRRVVVVFALPTGLVVAWLTTGFGIGHSAVRRRNIDDHDVTFGHVTAEQPQHAAGDGQQREELA